VEKLTTRRLLPDTEVRVHSVSNPLAEPATEHQSHLGEGR
jgi:hypothetical protein